MNVSSETIEQNTTSNAGINRRYFQVTAIAAALALTLGGIAAIAKTNSTLPDSSPLIIAESAVQALPSFSTLIQSVQPAVVNITVDGK